MSDFSFSPRFGQIRTVTAQLVVFDDQHPKGPPWYGSRIHFESEELAKIAREHDIDINDPQYRRWMDDLFNNQGHFPEEWDDKMYVLVFPFPSVTVFLISTSDKSWVWEFFPYDSEISRPWRLVKFIYT